MRNYNERNGWMRTLRQNAYFNNDNNTNKDINNKSYNKQYCIQTNAQKCHCIIFHILKCYCEKYKRAKRKSSHFKLTEIKRCKEWEECQQGSINAQNERCSTQRNIIPRMKEETNSVPKRRQTVLKRRYREMERASKRNRDRTKIRDERVLLHKKNALLYSIAHAEAKD